MIQGSNKNNWHILAHPKHSSHGAIKDTWQVKREKTLARVGQAGQTCVASQEPRNHISIRQLTSKPRSYSGAKSNTLAYKYN